MKCYSCDNYQAAVQFPLLPPGHQGTKEDTMRALMSSH